MSIVGILFTCIIANFILTVINVSRDTGKNPPADMEQGRMARFMIIRIAFLTPLLSLWDKTCQLALYAASPIARLSSIKSFDVDVIMNSWRKHVIAWLINIMRLTIVPWPFFNRVYMKKRSTSHRTEIEIYYFFSITHIHILILSLSYCFLFPLYVQ